MTYVVSYRGLTVTCGDLDALDQLADRAQRKPFPSPSKIHEVVLNMGELGRQLLMVILNSQQIPMPQSVLLKLLDYNEHQLTGAITAVSKPMIKAGFTKEDVLRVVVPNGHGGERLYSLVPAAIDEVRRGLGVK